MKMLKTYKGKRANYFRDRFRYDHKTGKLYWLERPRSDFKHDGWHTRFNRDYAGRETGTVLSRVIDKNSGMVDVLGLVLTINRKMYYVHRIIFLMEYGEVPKIIDHLDINPLNNKLPNLEASTRSKNGMNSRKRRGATSDYKGVSRQKLRNNWRSQIQENGKLIWIGVFDCEIEAAKAYDKAALQYRGKSAVLNFPVNGHY